MIVNVRGNNSYKILNMAIAYGKFSININFYDKLSFFPSKITTICPMSSLSELSDL